MASKSKYANISIPKSIANEIDELIEELGYWPSRGAFAREPCITKIKEKRRLKRLREAKGV
jgi:metal-responsive CopG/Arc/MetJ family transcriptional regulator